MKKIPNFFPVTFMENHWKIGEKQPKKTFKIPQKTRCF